MSSNNQARNQELFGAGKVSWNGEHFDKRFMYDIQKKGQGRNIGVFSPKCIDAHFCKISAPFSIFKKGQGRTSPLFPINARLFPDFFCQYILNVKHYQSCK